MAQKQRLKHDSSGRLMKHMSENGVQFRVPFYEN